MGIIMNNAGMGLIRKNNTRNRILHIIRSKKKVSKIDIKKISRYSMVTVLDTIDSLVKDGLVFYAEKVNSKKSGRRPTYISINPGGGYFLGLSFHAAEISLALLDYCGETLDFRRYVLDQKKLSVNYVLEYIYSALNDILARHSKIRPKIIGLGVGAPGYVDENQGLCVFYPHIEKWHSIPLQKLLAGRIPDIPIFIDHNTNAMLLAYRWLRPESTEGHTSVLISIRSGIRMSFMIGSSLYKGKNYTAGEIGHIKVAGGSRYCPCGKKGCLESEISEKAIRIKILEGVRVNRFSELWKNAEYRESKVNLDLFIRSIQSGEADSIALLDEICDYLGDSITQIVNILNPSRVILNTGLCALGSVFFDRLKTNVWDRGVFVALDGLSLEPVAFGERTAAIGAAAIVMERELDFVDAII
jgi:predicted NBD/HSP70 family sugar kinase